MSGDGPPADEDGARADAQPDASDGAPAAVDGSRRGLDDGRIAALLARLDVIRAVVALTAVALLARLVALGARVQHFDEGRVGWWTLEFMRTGAFEYRYIIHGPFVQHVNTWVFSVLGATDFASRLPVALVGGLLPLAALLFREHLRDEEVVATALFLALNPTLLYYSRFFRSTMLVAAFMTVAFGLVVRWIDTRRPLYAHLAVALVALGFTAKENAVVYLLCWAGAGTLAVALFGFARHDGRTGTERARAALDRLRATVADGDWLARGAGHAVLAAVVFAAVVTFFYAPRAGTAGGVGLYQALFAPGQFPEVASVMLGDITEGYGYWFGHSSSPGCHKDNVVAGYACFLGRSLRVLAYYAAPLVGLALVGTFVEHFAVERPRALVLVTSYWGFVSVVGYPLGTDIFGAWIMVNALVPLAVPAGVGLALVYRRGREALAADDAVGVGLAALLVALVVLQMAAVGVQTSYLQPTADSNELVQFAQPQQDIRATLADTERLARDNDGTDLLVYGEFYVDGDEASVRTPACVKWFTALSLPWYWERDDVTVGCAMNATDLGDRIDAPVVFARDTADNRRVLEERLGDGYETRTHYMRTIGDEVVVYVRDS